MAEVVFKQVAHSISKFNVQFLVDGVEISKFDRTIAECKQKKVFRNIHQKKSHVFEMVNNDTKMKVNIEHVAIYVRFPVVAGFND